MEHRDIRLELAARIRALLAESASLPQPLRPYQYEATEKIGQWLEDPGGSPRGYIQHATGLGKTVMFAALLRHTAGLRALVIVPSKVLIAQTARKLVRFVGGLVGHLSSLDRICDLSTGDVVAVHGHAHQSIVITTDQWLKMKPGEIANDFKPHLIIRDECHWGYSPTSQWALAHCPHAVVVGFSATPDYVGTVAKPGYIPVTLDNGQVLYGDPKRFAHAHFGECLDIRTARWGMEHGWLCPLSWGHIDFGASLDGVPVKLGPAGLDYDPKALRKLMQQHWPMTCETIRRLYASNEHRLRERQVFAVCPGVQAAQMLADTLTKDGIAAACVVGATDSDERDARLQAFDRKELNFISSVRVLREGWDPVYAEVCFMLDPTKSWVAYEQPVGRTLRVPENYPDKIALCIDPHFEKTTFEPLSAPLVYGKVGEILREYDLIVSSTGRDARGGYDSPYAPPIGQTRKAVRVMQKTEYWAGSDDTFQAEGRTWASSLALSRSLNVSLREIIRVIYRSVPIIMGKLGKTSQGKLDRYYPIDEVERALCRSAVPTQP